MVTVKMGINNKIKFSFKAAKSIYKAANNWYREEGVCGEEDCEVQGAC